MSGTVNVARSLWDDPTFKDAEMTQREVWLWMIAEASWKARTRRVGVHEVELQRGQLCASTRFMASTFMWSEPRVRRYLDMLENRRMIQRKTDAGVTIITICKYNDYQNTPNYTDAGPTRQPTRDRRTSDARQNKDEIRLLASSRSSSAREDENSQPENLPANPPPAPTITTEADDLYSQVLTAVGLSNGPLPTYWMPPGAIIHVNRWLALGLHPEEVIGAARASRANHQDPPSGPKALDRVMTALASAKQLPAISIPQATGGQNAKAAQRHSDANERQRRIILAAARGTTD